MHTCGVVHITTFMCTSITVVATQIIHPVFVRTVNFSFATLTRTTVFVRFILPNSVRTIAKASVAVIEIVEQNLIILNTAFSFRAT